MKLIDAETLKHKFAQITYIRFTADMGQGGFEMFSEKEIEDIIDKAPAVENQRPQGEWIVKTLSTFPQYQPDEYECPFCRTIVNYKTNFCHHCGARMQEANAK